MNIRESRKTPNLQLFQVLGFTPTLGQSGVATIAHPLYALLKKDVAWTWSHEAQEAFNTLKEKLSEFPILRRPDFNKVFILHTDWSALGIRAILGQLDEEGKEYVIAYASRSNNKAESNYLFIRGGVPCCCMGCHTFQALSLWHQFHFVYRPPAYQMVDDQ
jgi:hypothetical protein